MTNNNYSQALQDKIQELSTRYSPEQLLGAVGIKSIPGPQINGTKFTVSHFSDGKQHENSHSAVIVDNLAKTAWTPDNHRKYDSVAEFVAEKLKPKFVLPWRNPEKELLKKLEKIEQTLKKQPRPAVSASERRGMEAMLLTAGFTPGIDKHGEKYFYKANKSGMGTDSIKIDTDGSFRAIAAYGSLKEGHGIIDLFKNNTVYSNIPSDQRDNHRAFIERMVDTGYVPKITDGPKYEIIPESRTVMRGPDGDEPLLGEDGNQIEIYRVRALKDIVDSEGTVIVPKGGIGGWIQDSKNLDQKGNSWPLRDTVVYGNGRLEDNAQAYNSTIECTVGGDCKVHRAELHSGEYRAGVINGVSAANERENKMSR